MAVFRIEKTKDYTVMSNHHLRNKDLSLKAKGLLSQILSLPENWDYTLKGLSYINRESVDAIRSAVQELERSGYIIRTRERKENGQLGGSEYVIYELPQFVQPTQNKPISENPIQVNSILENPTQLITNRINTKELNTDLSNINPSINPVLEEQEPSGINKKIDKIDGYEGNVIEIYRNIIKDAIEYDTLCLKHDPERVAEILELILETVCSSRKTIRINGEGLRAEIVKSRFMKLNQLHVEYVFECISKNTTKINNIKSYLLTALYNATLTMGHYYVAEVNHDFYGSDNGW